jgi:hypothetical protein
MKIAPEPTPLRRGKAFHRRLQAEWRATADGQVSTEKSVRKASGALGRIDIHASSEGALVGVVEIKASDWNRMTDAGLRPNVLRHARQVWTYIDSQLADGKEVSPGIIYPAMPSSEARRDLIESLLEQQGIAVVWEDERVSARKRRAE